jgi:flagellar hook-associated protein 2
VTQSISGLGSGLDTAAIIQQLVALERRSVDIVKARSTKAQVTLATYDGLREQMTKLRTASLTLARTASWRPLTATSSDEDAVTVSAGTGTFGGSLSFTVDALANTGSIRSNFTLAGTTATVAADTAILVAAGGARIGFAGLASDDALATGEHTITVTQSSEAAVKTGTGALADSTVIDGSNDTLTITVNGDAKVLTIAAGTYDRDELAAAVQDAADAAGAAVTVTVDTSSNAMSISTSREGSAATLQVTGGTALTPLLLAVDGSAITGADGKVKVGDEVEQTVSSIEAGGSMVLNASAGTITATFAGGLREGDLTAANVSVGDGSLATVVSNLNAANAGITASAVLVGANTYRLQITSNTAGALNGATIAAAEFSAAVGGFVTLTEASDAVLTVGTGPGAYQVVSETNTVAGLLPGITVTLKSTTASPVTVSASRDVNALAENVQALVDAANGLKAAIDTATKYDPETKQASPLTGDAVSRRILSDLSRALTDAVPGATPGSPGLAGLSIDRDGKYVFDSGKFTTAFNADPEGVTRLFSQSGTATSSDVSFVSAGDRARGGTYEVEITQIAEKASAIGLEGSWPIGSPPTVRVRVGSTTVEYEVGASDTQQDVVDALNAAFADEELELTATISGTGVEITTNAYGASAKFDVAWDGTTWVSHAGVDVAGTIDGETATGLGQRLSMPFDHQTLGGLTLQITATTTGSLGTFDYQPGAAQRAVTSLLDATDAVYGYLTSTEKALRSRIDFIDDHVESMERRIAQYEVRLRRQFATLESTLGLLQQQSSWLAGQVNSLNGTST